MGLKPKVIMNEVGFVLILLVIGLFIQGADRGEITGQKFGPSKQDRLVFMLYPYHLCLVLPTFG